MLWTALRGGRPASVPSEDDELWGAEDPPTPAKQPYVYPADRPEPAVETTAVAAGTLATGDEDLVLPGHEEPMRAEDEAEDDGDAPSLAELYRRRAAPAAGGSETEGGTPVDRTEEEER